MEEMVSLDKAFEIIDGAVRPLPAEPTEVMLSGSRVLAEKVSAWVDLPGADVSVLDGYAVRAGDLSGAGPGQAKQLKIAGQSTFTSRYEDIVPPESCIKVFSGSVIPEGLDAVVGFEDVEAGEEQASFSSEVSPGQGVRKKGEEFRVGETIAEPGAVLTPGLISLLVASGWGEIKALRIPRSRVMAVGDEIMPSGRTLEPGEVYPSSAAGIVAWLRMKGATDVRLNLVVDDHFDIQEALARPHETDLVITIGGTGKSERDVVIEALDERGVEILFKGIKAKPGHYAAFGMMEQTPVFCLPGGPAAANMMFHLLVKRTMNLLMGIAQRALPLHRAIMEKSLANENAELDHLYRLKLERSDQNVVAVPFEKTPMHREIAEAQAILRLPPGKSVSKGDQVEIWLIK